MIPKAISPVEVFISVEQETAWKDTSGYPGSIRLNFGSGRLFPRVLNNLRIMFEGVFKRIRCQAVRKFIGSIVCCVGGDRF